MGKKFLLSSLLASLLLSQSYALGLGGVINIPTQKENNSSMPNFALSEAIITFKDNTPMSEINKMLSSIFSNFTSHEYSIIKGMHIKVPGMGFDMIKNMLENSPINNYIKTIEKNYEFEIKEDSNDPYFSKLWAIKNTGQEVNGQSGSVDADMDVDEAWKINKGSSDTIIAILDTGVDYTHNDLANNMWRGNSKHGYDFAGDNEGNNDNDPMPEKPYDENGHYHGTHVAGIIGAVGNNELGISGVTQNVQLMALKIFRPNGHGYSSDILEALDFVSKEIDNGVKVAAINASYGGGGGSNGDSMDQAIQKLGDKGVVFVAAAGNDGKDIDKEPIYPASYSATNIITVAASDQNDKLASFSNYGKNSVEVAAPGVNILSTYPDNKYAYAQGTSMAAPEVTGVIALLDSINPNSTIEEKINAIKDSIDKKSDLSNKVSTSGRVNSQGAAKIIANSSDKNTPPKANSDSAETKEDTPITIDVLANDSDIDGDTLTIKITKMPKYATAVIENNRVKYTPNRDYNGKDSFSYVANDGKADSNEAEVDIKIKPVNDAPIAKDDSARVDEDKSVVINVLANDSDIDKDKLTIKSFTTPKYGKVVKNDKEELIYTPNENYNGSDSFSYTISDGNGAEASAKVAIKINSINDAPIAKDDEAKTNQNEKILIDVLANDSDIDGDKISISEISTPPKYGEAKIIENKIEYTPNKDYNGEDSFSYTIKDTKGAKAKANVKITINKTLTKDDNQEKNTTNPPKENNTTTPPKDNNTSNPPKDNSKENNTTTPPKNNENNATPPKDNSTPPKEDNNTQKENKNHIPFPKKDGTFFLNKNSSEIFDVLANDSDIDGDKLFIKDVIAPKHGVVQIIDNKIKYTPHKDYTGSDYFYYIVSDSKGAEAKAKVDVMVTQDKSNEYSFPIIGDNNIEIPTKIIGEFKEIIKNNLYIFKLKDKPGEIDVNGKSGEVEIKGINAPIPNTKLPAGTTIKAKDNKLEVEFKLNTNIKFK